MHTTKSTKFYTPRNLIRIRYSEFTNTTAIYGGAVLANDQSSITIAEN